MAMSQPYVLIKPYKQFQAGHVIEPGSLLGEGLVRLQIALKVAPREVTEMAKVEPGALPYFPDKALQQLFAKRGLIEAKPDKVSSTKMVRR